MSLAESTPATKQLSTAAAPFNKLNADVTLRTSDLVDFHVFSQVLIAASPFFEGMFDVPQPPPEPELKRPIIEVSEDSKALDTVLRICYPIKKQKQLSLEEIEPAIRTAMKYEMELPTDVLEERLEALVPAHPMEVWAIACRLRLEDTACMAADNMKSCEDVEGTRLHPILRFEARQLLQGVSAGDFFRLSEYLRPGASETKFSFSPFVPCKAASHPDAKTIEETLAILQVMPCPDITCRSSDGIEFHAHQTILKYASNLVDISETAENSSESGPAEATASPSPSLSLLPPVIPLDICGVDLATLLLMSYDRQALSPSILSYPSRVLRILTAAESYGFRFALPLITSRWKEVVKSAPLQSYCVAAVSGRAACAKEAAQYVVTKRLSGVYVCELEDTPALSYLRLLKYDEACHDLTREHLRQTMEMLYLPPRPPVNFKAQGGQATKATCAPAPQKQQPIMTISSALQTALESTSKLFNKGTWARRFVFQSVCDTYSSVSASRIAAPSIGELFTRATTSEDKMWCAACQPLAEDLLEMERRYRQLMNVLDGVDILV